MRWSTAGWCTHRLFLGAFSDDEDDVGAFGDGLVLDGERLVFASDGVLSARLEQLRLWRTSGQARSGRIWGRLTCRGRPVVVLVVEGTRDEPHAW